MSRNRWSFAALVVAAFSNPSCGSSSRAPLEHDVAVNENAAPGAEPTPIEGDDGPLPAVCAERRSIEGPPMPVVDTGVIQPLNDTGGTIRNGLYVSSRVTFERAVPSVSGAAILFEDGRFYRNKTVYFAASGAPLTGSMAAGTFTTRDNTLKLSGAVCNIAGAHAVSETYLYAAMDDRLHLVPTTGEVSRMEIYVRATTAQ